MLTMFIFTAINSKKKKKKTETLPMHMGKCFINLFGQNLLKQVP